MSLLHVFQKPGVKELNFENLPVHSLHTLSSITELIRESITTLEIPCSGLPDVVLKISNPHK